MQRLGGMERPVGIAQQLPRQQHDVSLAGGHDLLSLERLGDEADRSAGDSRLRPNLGRKGDLETGTEGNLLIRHRKPGGTVDEVYSDFLQLPGQNH